MSVEHSKSNTCMEFPIKQTNPHAIDRPDPKDVLYSELNLEQWTGLWATTDGKEIRHLRRRRRLPNGDEVDLHLTVEPSHTAGDLTTETNKVLTALLMARQEAWGQRGENAPAHKRMKFTIRQTSKLLHPGDQKRDSIWGSQTLASIKRHIRKLNKVNIVVHGSFWDAEKQKNVSFEHGFSIIPQYLIAEERKYKKGASAQLPLEYGFIQFADLIEKNLQLNYTAPIYYKERMKIKAPFALQLYNMLTLAMTGITTYQRKISHLFEQDFPEMGIKYPIPAQRRRTLQRQFKHLKGRKITSGILADLTIERTTDSKDWKLVVIKEPFPTKPQEETDHTPEVIEETILPTNLIKKDDSFAEWSTKIDDGVQSVGEIVKDALDQLTEKASPHQAENAELDGLHREEALLDEMVKEAGDDQSRENYRHQIHHAGQNLIRAWISECRQGEHDGLPRNLRLQTLYKQWCGKQGIEPYWIGGCPCGRAPKSPSERQTLSGEGD